MKLTLDAKHGIKLITPDLVLQGVSESQKFMDELAKNARLKSEVDLLVEEIQSRATSA